MRAERRDTEAAESGKTIASRPRCAESRWISQAVVYGDNQPWLVALLTLDPEGPPALTAKAGCEPDFSPRVPGELEAAVDLRAALRGAA